MSASAKVASLNAPRRSGTVPRLAATAAAFGGLSRLSAIVTRAPCASSQRAADTPVSPRPITMM
ncbi:hypothetical protein D3C72_2222610 [compost metagenome]